MTSEASIFNAARKIKAAEDRNAFLVEACGADKGLRERVDVLLAAFMEESQFLEQPAPGLGQTVDLQPGDGDFSASLGAGLAATFFDESAVVIGNTNHSVLKSMSASLSDVPRISLQEPKDAGGDPIQRPSSPEIPKQESDSRYQLHGEIARGGMGAVLRGRDTDLGRDLAVKVLLDAHKDKPEVVQRFLEEAQIGGQLQHPGIAPVYELGQFADQRPFFSMKLVKGDTLSKLLLDREAPTADRSKLIGIFEHVCQTMAYAHSRGVIHRDLKPANIMVGAFGEVQVMDWGLAKVLSVGGVADEKATRKKQHGETMIQTMRSVGSDAPGSIGSTGSETQAGSVMGTPAYMPPEQALGEIDLLDQRADVFGLGAILAEILTGQPPYVAEDGTQIYRMASRGKLGDCFDRLDACGADEELVSLAKQCLEVEPADRPKDASALAEKVTGYLESVETKLRESEVELAGEAARVVEQKKRFRVTLGLSAAALTILLAGIAATAWQASEANKQTLVAQAAKKEATDEADIARKAEERALHAKDAAEVARVAEAKIAQQRRRELYAANMQLADQLYNGQNGEQKRIEQLLAAWIPVDDQEEDLREFTWRYQWHRLHKSANLTVQTPCKAVAFTPENKMVVTDSDGLHEVDEDGNKRELINWSLDVYWSYFSPDGRWAAINVKSGIDLYHVKSRTKVLSLPQNRCAFSSNGEYLAAFRSGANVDSLAPDEDAIPVWKLEQNGTATSIAPLIIGDLAKLPVGGSSLTLSNDGTSFLLRNIPDGFQVGAFLNGNPKPIKWALTDGAWACAWSPDGQVIASAGGMGIVELRLKADVSQKLTIRTHGRLLRTVRFSSDGSKLAVGGIDGTIDIWDVSGLASFASLGTQNQQDEAKALEGPSIQTAAPRLIRTIKAHISPISSFEAALNFSADGNLLASQDSTGTVKLWALTDAFEDQPETKVDRLSEAKAVGNGSESRATIGVAQDDLESRAAISGPGFELSSTQFDVSQLAEDLISGVIPIQPTQELCGLPKIDRVAPEDIVQGSVESGERIAAVFDPDEGVWQELKESALILENENLVSGPTGTIVRLKLENSQGEQNEVTLRRPKVSSLGTLSVTFSPDAKHVAVAGTSDGVTRLDLRNSIATRHPIRASSVAYSPDGRLLAVAGMTEVFILDSETDEELYRVDSGLDSLDAEQFPAWNQFCGDLIFSPDGKFLAHVSGFRYAPNRSDLTVYRTSDFKKIGDGPLHKSRYGLQSLVFSPDSSRLLVGDNTGRVQIWGTSDWKTRTAIATPHTMLSSMAISPDGKRLYVGSRIDNRSVTIWDLETRKQLHRLNSQRIGYMALSPDGRTLALGSFDHNVSLWDADTGMRLQTIQAHEAPVFGVAFSNDGKRLATVDKEAILRFWDADINSDIRKDAATLQALTRLGLWRLEQNRDEEAEALFSKVAQLSQATAGADDVLGLWDVLLPQGTQQDASTLQALLHLGNKRLKQKRFEEADALFSKVAQLGRNAILPNPRKRAAAKTALESRALLMEHLGRWDEAIKSRDELASLHPFNVWMKYQVASALLRQQENEKFWKVWHEILDQWRETDLIEDARFSVKLRLLVDVPGHELQASLKLADMAFEKREGSSASLAILLKGMAEYRRGNFAEALQYFEDAKNSKGEGGGWGNPSMSQYFTSMAHHRLGDSVAAKAAFVDASKGHKRQERYLRGSPDRSWHHWQQTEVVRREASALLGIDESPSEDSTDVSQN